MIIGNSTQGTTRDKISNLRGEKVDMNKIDPDDRDVDDSEKEWKDFY